MKTVCIVFGLLIISMTAQGLDLAKLSQSGGVAQSEGKEALEGLQLIRDITSALNEIVKNVKETRDVLDTFGGPKGFKAFDLGDYLKLYEYEQKEAEIEEEQQLQEFTTNPPPVVESASVKRSMRRLLDELAKLTQKK